MRHWSRATARVYTCPPDRLPLHFTRHMTLDGVIGANFSNERTLNRLPRLGEDSHSIAGRPQGIAPTSQVTRVRYLCAVVRLRLCYEESLELLGHWRLVGNFALDVAPDEVVVVAV